MSDYVNLVPGVVGFFETSASVAFGARTARIDDARRRQRNAGPGWGTPTTAPSPSWIDEVQVATDAGRPMPVRQLPERAMNVRSLDRDRAQRFSRQRADY